MVSASALVHCIPFSGAPLSQRESLINGSVLYASNGAVLQTARPVSSANIATPTNDASRNTNLRCQNVAFS